MPDTHARVWNVFEENQDRIMVLNGLPRDHLIIPELIELMVRRLIKDQGGSLKLIRQVLSHPYFITF